MPDTEIQAVFPVDVPEITGQVENVGDQEIAHEILDDELLGPAQLYRPRLARIRGEAGGLPGGPDAVAGLGPLHQRDDHLGQRPLIRKRPGRPGNTHTPIYQASRDPGTRMAGPASYLCLRVISERLTRTVRWSTRTPAALTASS